MALRKAPLATMWHSLTDHPIPVALAALLGLLVGWFMWRWQKRPVNARDYARLVETEANTTSELNMIRSANTVLDTELQAQRSNFVLLEQQASALQNELGALNAHRAASAGGLTAATNAQAELQANLDAVTAQLEAVNADRASMYTNLQAFADDRTKLVAALEAAAAERTRLHEALAAGATHSAVTPAVVGANDAELVAQLQAATHAQDALQAELHESMALGLQLTADLEEADADRAELRLDLDTANKGIVSLREECEAVRAAQAQEANAAMHAMHAELERSRAQVVLLQGQRGDSPAGETNAGATAGDPSATESELAAERASTASLKAELETARRAAADAAVARTELANSATRISELEAQLAAAPPAASDSLESLAAGSWKRGTTKLGTPGADHTDDLKQITGIGPKMETVLNDFGIVSWEQLAALTESEVATVDGALTDFPGRIQRDAWVEQAQAFITNGHAPPARAPRVRKDKDGRAVISEWALGETTLGIAGAVHTDDLKVINGIGPKMETILNSFGITSWEQVASFKKADVERVTQALDTFAGRIERDEWVGQAKDLVKRFPLTSPYHRPNSDTV